jgi:hypothetical protein
MTSFRSLKIDAASFATVRQRLVAGVGFFADGPYRYVVADSDVYRFDVVLRTRDISWSETVKALPKTFKAVVNGGYFSCPRSLYAQAQFTSVKPTDVDSDGEVKKGGASVLPDDGKGKDYFFFGHDGGAPPRYDVGQGNPGSSVNEGMGGLGPMIFSNPVSKAPLKFGVGNQFASDPAKASIPTAKDFADCTQRNNNTYASLQGSSAAGTGFCVVAAIPNDRLLVMVIKPHNTPGDLDTLRDALLAVGAAQACFTDGSTSACLAVDGQMESGMAPATYKDNVIETGFGLFLYKPPPPTKLVVTFIELRVFDNASSFGAGTWTVDADVSGSKLNLMRTAAVEDDDVITFGGHAVTVTVASGADLVVKVTGLDEAGIDDDLGTVSQTFGPVGSPPFGVGRHVGDTDFYRITFDVALSP